MATDYTYSEVLTIPKGATSIEIQEITPSPNSYIAMEGPSFSLNLNLFVKSANLQELLLGRVLWLYERPLNASEYLKADGPSTENVTISILTVGSSPGLRYKFYVPLNDAESVRYVWHYSNWSGCSVQCGLGNQTREVSCVRHTSGSKQVVNENLCDSSSKPQSERTCQTPFCGWIVSEWSNCSSHCGEGMQTRTVSCHSNGTIVEVWPDSHCDLTAKPSSLKQCDNLPPCHSYQWQYSEYGECSASCGPGMQTREALCAKVTHGGEFVDFVPESFCEANATNSPRGPITQTCQMHICKWMPTGWGPCQATCGLGMMTQELACSMREMHGEQWKQVDSNFCNGLDQPALEKECQTHTCNWTTSGEVGPCSAMCGEGVQAVDYHCIRIPVEADALASPVELETIDNSFCDVIQRPNTRNCIAEPCENFHWYPSGWGKVITL